MNYMRLPFLKWRRMKNITRLLIFLVFFVIPNIASAANHYIRAGATGANDGSDWTNAWTNMPSSFVRGDTYYVADGSYTGRTLNTAVSGSAWIYIKKATTTNHGTDTGWVSSYGDGTATFTPFLINTSYWEINGQTRGGDWKSSYGFKIDSSSSSYAIKSTTAGVSNLTFKYIDIQGTGMGSGKCDISIDIKYGYHDNVTIAYNYIHDVDTGHIDSGGMNNFLVEYNYFARNNSTASCHGNSLADTASDNVIIRYNIWADIEGTGVITALNRDSIPRNCENWEIYGNVFFRSEGNPYGMGDLDLGIVQVINQQSAINWKIYNNTAVNLFKNVGGVYLEDLADQNHNGVYVYNNFWYNSTSGGLLKSSNCTNCIADYNYYMQTTHVSETNEENYSTKDPSIFVNFNGENFHLTQSSNAGATLSSPYTIDMDGNTRGADGNWDRGAFELDSGVDYTVNVPNPPTNVTIN